MSLLDSGDYETAYPMLEELGKTDVIYDRAMAYINSGDYETGYELLKVIGNDYEIASNKYDRAMALINSGDYDAAYELLEEIGKTDEIASNKYDRAMALIDSGDSASAYELLQDLQISNKFLSEHPEYQLTLVQIGDTITFGTYEQDNDLSNGKEDIEWLVLDKQENKLLAISRFALDSQPYNNVSEHGIWANCTLREWLNKDFYNTAFSEVEKKSILQTNVPYSNIRNSTVDMVFLLSIEEANQYFSSSNSRMCAPTKSAIANGVDTSSLYTVDGAATCSWWLRSTGPSWFGNKIAAFVATTGVVRDQYEGRGVTIKSGVRPAMWIDALWFALIS